MVTWYNNSEEVFFFTARISFTDSNSPDESDAAHPWFTMRSYTDYRNTYSEILPNSYAKTVFNITDSGVHKTDGNHSLVNINLAIEWFSTYQKPYLVCDKIELLNDADISPPAKPSGLSAETVSDSKIHLGWTASSDNVGVVEYLVYMDGEIEGYSRSPEYTCVYLEPDNSYTFSVTALDAAGNESPVSSTATAATQPYKGRTGVLDPSGVDYLGAVAVPETFYWGGEAIAYNPEGDGGWAGTADGHPGSIFITNVNQPEYGWVGEISIPYPSGIGGKNIEELNQAVTLTQPVNIRPSSVNAWDFVDIWRTGLEVVPDEGRLYSSWSVHYTVTQEKHASISWCNISNLSGSARNGAWYVGASGISCPWMRMRMIIFSPYRGLGGRAHFRKESRHRPLQGRGIERARTHPVCFFQDRDDPSIGRQCPLHHHTSGIRTCGRDG